MRPRLLTALAILAAAAPAEAGVPLAAHRAVYDLTLDGASDRSGISALSGRMVYEFGGSSCDGYTVNFRFVTRIRAEDQERLTDQQTSSYEDGAGRTFDFVTKSFVDQQLDTETRGRAEQGAGGIAVTLDKPAAKSLTVDPALFPTAHMRDMIARAERGETFYEQAIFDGSEDADRTLTTTVVMGPKAESKADDPEVAGALGGKAGPYWPVTVAYFDPKGEGGGEIPTYRIEFKLQADGVTRDLTMDYGEFQMKGRLVDLSMLKRPDCPGDGP